MECQHLNCHLDAEVAINTLNSEKKDGLVHTLFTSLADAPKNASRLCLADASALLTSLVYLGHEKAAV